MKNQYSVQFRQWCLVVLGVMGFVLSARAQTVQPPTIQWQRILEPVNPGGANGRGTIIRNSQGGYSVVTADQRLVSLTTAGDVLSDTPLTDVSVAGTTARVLSAISPVLTADGAIAIGILSQTEGWKLQKRNVSGEIIWTSNVPFSVPSRDYQYQVSSVVASLDGGYFVFATRNDNTYADPLTPAATYVKITHYGSTGYLLSDQELRYSTVINNLSYINGTRVNKAIKTPDGGFLLVGLANPTSSNSTLRGWAAKLDAQGTVVWQNRYESMNTLDDAAVSATGSYLLSGAAISTPAGLFSSSTLRVDAAGNQGNNAPVLVPYPAFNSLSSIVSTPSGYIIGNDTAPGVNNGDIRLTNFSEQGIIIWTKTIGGSGRDFNYTPDILVTNDGYVVVGQTASTDGDIKGKQTTNVANWIVKLQNPANALTLTQPTYNCQTGAITFNTTGGDGSPITYAAPGITRANATDNVGTVEQELRNDPKLITIQASQSGKTVNYTFDLTGYCATGTTNPDILPLIDLYNATNGSNWINNTNWLKGDSPCNWFGISCDGNGRVTGIKFTSNNLNGTLPASLGNLSQLKSLIFFTEPLLSGSIPTSLGNLSQLETLEIEYTKLSGNIPASLGNLSQLKSLFLAVNQLSGSVPASLGTLPKLQSLYLFANQLSGCFPTNLSALCGKDVRTYFNSGLPGGGDFDAFCATKAGACPTSGTLTLLAPTYNCSTGAITFNTSGGDGSAIEYMAIGITGWTINPNQFVDKESRTVDDVQPFTLMARQNGQTITYTWNLKAACGRARLQAESTDTSLRLMVLGNPVQEQLRVLIQGADGQSIMLRLTDLTGRLIESRTVLPTDAIQEQVFELRQQKAGLLLLRASSGTRQHTVKVLRQ